MIYWLLAMVLVAALALWLRQRHGKHAPAEHVAAGPVSGKYHCVTISNSNHPCEAVKRLGGKRYFPSRAPRFPLAGCTADDCQCHYVHYDDRRDEERRNIYGRYGSNPPATIDHERRDLPGRRNTDAMDLDEHQITGHF